MKASAFSYARASSVVDALQLLARHGDQAKVLSGGQSLMPALNLRLSAPDLLVDIGALTELRGVSVTDGVLRIGALTRHVDVLRSADIAKYAPLLTEAIAHVAHPAIRNKGTFGGSLAHADPASELPAGPSGTCRVLGIRVDGASTSTPWRNHRTHSPADPSGWREAEGSD